MCQMQPLETRITMLLLEVCNETDELEEGRPCCYHTPSLILGNVDVFFQNQL